MTEEWGAWIKHDGKGCPVPVGTVCLINTFGGLEFIAVAGCHVIDGFIGVHGNENDPKKSCWVWDEAIFPQNVKRYRIRKPRALHQLRELVENLPEGVDA